MVEPLLFLIVPPPQEDLTAETTKKILDAFSKGQKPKPGPQSGRQTSENLAGLTALTSKVCSSCPRLQSRRLTICPALWSWRVLYPRFQLDRQTHTYPVDNISKVFWQGFFHHQTPAIRPFSRPPPHRHSRSLLGLLLKGDRTCT